MKIVWTLLIVVSSLCTYGQTGNDSPILLIYDASGSMWGQIEGETKRAIANSVLSDVLGKLPADQHVGLIAYGHRKKGDCQDIEYVVPSGANAQANVTTAIENIKPLGKTPLADAAQQAIDVLVSEELKATIILITDGIESCGGDICTVVKRAKEQGIDFRMHIVGFGLKEGETGQLECAALAGEGNYFDAQDADGLSEVLTAATQQTVDEPDENVTFYASKNGEPLDAWVRAYRTGQKKATHFTRTYRDTGRVYIEPGTYTMEVRPLENSDIKAARFEMSIPESGTVHKDVSFDAGRVEVYATDNGDGWDALVELIDVKTGKRVASVRTYKVSKTMDVDPGEYKIVYNPLAIKGPQKAFDDGMITVLAGETIQSDFNFDSGYVSVGAQTGSGEKIDAVLKFKHMATGKTVESRRTYTSANNNPRTVHLAIGEYRVSAKPLGAHKALNQKEFTVKVQKGKTAEEILIW